MSHHDIMVLIAKPFARNGGPTASETRMISEAAEAILAAGYRKSQTIAIIEELLELKEGTTILDDVGEVLFLQGREDYIDWFDQWGNCCHVNLPATVLHTPEVA
jgi:hypothetical protein